LVFSFIPLVMMAGAAYLRARTLMREQAIEQTNTVVRAQLGTINKEIQDKQAVLEHLVAGDANQILIELALHANKQSREFGEISTSMVKEFIGLNEGGSSPAFDHFVLMDSRGLIRIATRPEWQGLIIPEYAFINESGYEGGTHLLFGFPPLYQELPVLITFREYTTSRGSILGVVVGITESKGLSELVNPLQAINPSGSTYFLLPSGHFLAMEEGTEGLISIDPSNDTRDELTMQLEQLIVENSLQPISLSLSAAEKGAALTQLQWIPSFHAGVAMELSRQTVYGNMNSLIPFSVALVIFLIIATSLLLRIGTERVIKPLRALSEVTQRFSEGDWSKRAEVTSNDEVGLLARSFNHMAEELSSLYHSLELKVEERTRQIRTAADIAQNISTLSNLDEMLRKTTQLLVDQFGFFQASVYMTDRSGKTVQFRIGHGEANMSLAERKPTVQVGSESIIGWVSENNLPRVASDIMNDSLRLKNELLPQTRSEAAVPISLGNVVLGILDVQSIDPEAFDSQAIVTLQTLASQIAAGIQTFSLSESSQVNFEEITRLNKSGRRVVDSENEEQVLRTGGALLRESPYTVMVLRIHDNLLETISASDHTGDEIINQIPRSVEINTPEIEEFLLGGPRVLLGGDELPISLREFTANLSFTTMAAIPIRKEDLLVAILCLGSPRQILNEALIQPYVNLADIMSVTLEKVDVWKQTQKHLREVESLASISEAVSTTSDLSSFYQALHNKVKQVVGDYGFMIALYDSKNDTIHIPYSYENGQMIAIEPFTLGEGLTSIIIRSQEPLMLVENTERRAAELGAKILGKPAKSWMGVPMVVQNQTVGALILQDTEQEYSFTEEDLLFFSTLAGQVAGVINNVRLLDESNRRALQLESAAIIARDISGSLNLDELLIKAVNLICEQFDYYHAAVYLHDLGGEFALVREATGEAGIQMKRQGYKIGVGSNSIIGFVTRHGGQLVINDLTKDETYTTHPLLPDTRSEAGLALKVGERILGALDVQSKVPYAFNQDNLRSLQILTDQLAIAVVNTELFAESQEHLSQHRLLHHITTTVASGTTLEEAMESAVNGLQVTLGGDRIMIFLLDREKQELAVNASIGYAGDATKIKVPVGSGIVGWVASQKRPLRIGNVQQDARYVQLSPNTRSEMAIPLIYRNELLGVLNVESEMHDAYTENDEEMLGTLGGSLAAIIANARLLEQIRQQAEKERLIYEITSKIRRSSDMQSILTTTASELTRVTGSKRTRIEIIPPTNGEDGP
jgi:GAF domain-containing protein/HAMP domain-containing protein